MEDNIIVISPKFRQPDVPQKKITLTGNVKDKEGRPLPGVTILLKGSAVGVVSDVDGNFTLTVPEESGLTLVFSFVGMKTQEVVLSGQQVLHIVMLEDVSQMEEVIVTGYQEVKKEKMTGAPSPPKNLVTVTLRILSRILRLALPVCRPTAANRLSAERVRSMANRLRCSLWTVFRSKALSKTSIPMTSLR